MPTQEGSINLLTASIEPQGKWDRIYSWTKNTAKYVVIVTELVVLAAIGVRFMLDGRINDLDKEIRTQKALLDGRQQEDQEVRRFAVALDSISELEQTDYTLTQYYKKIQDLIPTTVQVNALSVQISQVSLSGSVSNYDQLLVLENNIRNASFITDENFTTNQQPNNITFTANFKIAFQQNGR